MCKEVKAYGFPLYFRPENTNVYEEMGTTLCNGTRAGFTTGVIVLKNRAKNESDKHNDGSVSED